MKMFIKFVNLNIFFGFIHLVEFDYLNDEDLSDDALNDEKKY